MAAPAVQDLNALIAQYQAAFKPQADIIDQQVQQNDQSGVAAEAGLNAKKAAEFGGIEQAASNKGMAFSGFAPDQQAKYVGSTFLPALANLQSTITNTRLGLLGKKADLSTQANTQAVSQHQRELSAYQQWQAEQDRLAAQRAEAERTRQFQAQQNAANRSAQTARAAASQPAQPTVSQSILRAFAGAGYTKGAKGSFTENVLVPSLMADYGLSRADALAQSYAIRKQVYGD